MYLFGSNGLIVRTDCTPCTPGKACFRAVQVMRSGRVEYRITAGPGIDVQVRQI